MLTPGKGKGTGGRRNIGMAPFHTFGQALQRRRIGPVHLVIPGQDVVDQCTRGPRYRVVGIVMHGKSLPRGVVEPVELVFDLPIKPK